MNRYKYSTSAIIMASAFTMATNEARAQSAAVVPEKPGVAVAPKGELQEIVVTATKRSTNLQRTPVAVTALAGEALQQAQIHNILQIAALVPGVKLGDVGGYAQFTIRGIGSATTVPAGENPVALNLNEVYVSLSVVRTFGAMCGVN